MFSLLVAAAIGLTLLIGLTLMGHWIMGIIFGTLAFLVAAALISRHFMKKIQPLFNQAQKQAQAGQVPQALETLSQLQEFSKWQLLLESQIQSQKGILHYSAGDEDKAVLCLMKGHPKLTEGPLILASALLRKGETSSALAVLSNGIKSNKRAAMIYNFKAWVLHRENRTDDAIRCLQDFLKVEADNESTKNNVVRLQNGQKLDMVQFGDSWFMLKHEQPPRSMGMMQGRKGFRQAPKRPKQRKR